MSSEHRVNFAVLGPLEMTLDQRPINLGGRTPRALLAMLALKVNQSVRAQSLMLALWGDQAPATATNSLHSHVSRLRRLIEADGGDVRLERRPGGYKLCGDPDCVDAARFERLVREGGELARRGAQPRAIATLRAGLALWRGPALADFAERDFARSEAVRLEELRLDATASVLDLELRLGAAGALVPELEHVVRQHPMQERFWGQLMVALYRDGRQGDALAAYHRVRRQLSAELGVEPGPALRRLEELILRQSPDLELPVEQPLLGARTPGRISAPPSGAVFVGREEELAVLDEALATADRGAGQVVIIEAPPGLGKTALVEHFSARCAGEGIAVHLGRAWEDSGAVPYWPWVEVLRARAEHLAQPWDAAATELADLLPPGAAQVLRDHAQARFRLYQAVTQQLFGADKATVLVLEDLHGADDSSLALLTFVLRHLRRTHALLVLTHRPVAPDSALSQVLAGAAREVSVRRVSLPVLSDAQVRSYLQLTLGADVGEDVVAAAITRAEGHAFFLTEIARMVQDGRRRAVPARVGVSAHDIPRTVTEMIGRRFTELPDATLRVLLTAAVIGREFDLHLLSAVTGLDLDMILDQVEIAAGTGLVQESTGGRLGYRFDHALTHDTLYSRVPSPRRIVLHARVADAIEAGALGPGGAGLSELAHHRCCSAIESGVSAAVAAATRAGKAAGVALAHEEAARLHRLALHTHEQHQGAAAALPGLLLTVGRACGRAGQLEDARTVLLRAAAGARADVDAEQLARVALTLGMAFEARFYDQELVNLLQEALAALAPEHRGLRARLLARLAIALNLHDPLRQAPGLSAAALELAGEIDDPVLHGQCLSARAVALWGPDHDAAWRDCAASALDLAQKHGDVELSLDALSWLICADLEDADRPAAERRLSRHGELAVALRHPLHTYHASMWQATMAALDGRSEAALELAERAENLGTPLTAMAYPRHGAILMVVLRDLGRAEQGLAAANAVAERYPLLTSWRAGPVWIELELGNPEPARALFADLPTDLDSVIPRDGNWLGVVVMLAELAAKVGDTVRSATLHRALEPYAGRMGNLRFAVASFGPVDRALGLLCVVGGDLDGAEAHYRRAIRVSESVGARPFLARSECDYAAMLLRRGRNGDAANAQALLTSASATADELDLAGLAAYCAAASAQ
ncbi:MAG: BTAD domain-containing putative transcriptional regulator [Sporichthyaceae bacterium]